MADLKGNDGPRQRRAGGGEQGLLGLDGAAEFLTLPWPKQVTQWLHNGSRSSWRVSGMEEG